MAAPKKASESVVVPLANVGDGTIVTGFSSIEEVKQYLFGAVGLFVIREVYQFVKDRANKTGEKINHMDTKITEMTTKMDSFLRAYEKEEQRINDRIRRLEDKRVER